MQTARTFLAVPLSTALGGAIRTLQRELAGELPEARWTGLASLHLTLRFFGETSHEQLEKIKLSMLSVGLRSAPCAVRVTGLGAFPDLRRPRVVWLGLHPDRELQTLYRECTAQLAAAGFPAEPRAFAPHLTIGRFRQPGPTLQTLAARYAGQDWGELAVDRLVLYQSRLLPGGAQHIPLHTVALGAPAPGAGA